MPVASESVLVCNTGPLIALAGIGQVELLHILYDRVAVATAVRDELVASREKVGADCFERFPWLEVVASPVPMDPWLLLELDLGEAATLSLAQQLSADRVLIDERKARRVAQYMYKLPVVGTAGILLAAKRRGRLAQIRPLFALMRTNGYFLGTNLVETICHAAGE
jgi:predicted nucleic acid-binding protein